MKTAKGWIRSLLLIVVTIASMQVPLASTRAFAGSLTDITWTLGPAIPTPHAEGAMASIGNVIWSISGSLVDCSDVPGGDPSSAVTLFNTKTQKFTTGPSVNHPRTEDPVAANVGGVLYLIGGESQCVEYPNDATERTTEMRASGQGWADLPSTADLPSSLDGMWHCGTSVGTNIYYFTPNGIGVFDTTSRTWTVLPAGPKFQWGWFCRATRVGPDTVGKAKVYITGAGDGTDDSFCQRILVFRPSTGKIQVQNATTACLAEHGSALLDGYVVVTGGDFMVGVQAIKGSTVLTLSDLPQERDDALATVINGRYYIVGGTYGQMMNPDVMIGTPV